MPNIHTIRDFAPQNNVQYVYRPVSTNAYEDLVEIPERGATDLFSPRDPLDDSLISRCFPWISLYTFTAFISILEVTMFVVTLVVGGVKFDGAIVKGNNMLGPSAQTLKYMGGKYGPDIQHGEVWRLVTPIILHAGLLHLVSNMFFQLRFGFVLEVRWTTARFAKIYFLTGIGASFLSCIMAPRTVSVGASGALFGIIGADITYLIYNWDRIPQNKTEACMISFVVILNLLLGIGDSVDNWAHFGGLITGLLIGGCLPTPVQRRQEEKLIRWSFAAGTVALFLLFSLFVWVKP